MEIRKSVQVSSLALLIVVALECNFSTRGSRSVADHSRS